MKAKSKAWTCPTLIQDKDGNIVPCGLTCNIEHSGADHERINHLTDHNPSPAQWTAIHNAIQQGKERAKKQATA